MKKPDGYYVAVTCFVDHDKHEELKRKNIKRETDGYDAGCEHTYTRSDGCKCVCKVQQPKRLAGLQRKLESQERGSKRPYKNRIELRKIYQKLSNKKDDAGNKIFHQMMESETIVIQDEHVAEWQENGHGKAVNQSCLGRVKRHLENEAKYSDRVKILSKWLPTTKLCTHCGRKLNLELDDRIFECECGVYADRDTHAAQNMVWFYLHGIGVGKDCEISQEEITRLVSEAIAFDNQENIVRGRCGAHPSSTNCSGGSEDSK